MTNECEYAAVGAQERGEAVTDSVEVRHASTSRPRWIAATAKNLATGIIPWRRYQSQRPLTIVVLGMHRSGTSCIARMINLCGASVGRDVAAANWSNKAGHWEPTESVDINDAILRLSGGAWNNPPAEIKTDVRFRWRMKGFLGRLHEDGTAVWKDPRTVLTFPVWKQYLSRYQIVAVYRNPLSVAASLQRREEDFSLHRGLELWKAYNESLIEIVSQEANVTWIDFDAGLEHAVSRIQQIAKAADLNYSPDVERSYSPELRTSDAREEQLPPAITRLYEQLHERCAVSVAS